VVCSVVTPMPESMTAHYPPSPIPHPLPKREQ
jgi:hypothetical protein